MRLLKSAGKNFFIYFLVSLLAACGGAASTPATTIVTPPIVCSNPAPSSATIPALIATPPAYNPVIALGSVITDLKIESTGASAQTYVPFTLGHAFAPGALLVSDKLAGKLSNHSVIPLQLDVKATHADGSVRHAIISGILPALAVAATETIQLTKATLTGTLPAAPTPAGLVTAGLTASTNIMINCVAYTASLTSLLNGGTPASWLAGPIANEWIYSTPLKTTTDGVSHPHLTARFTVRSYAGRNQVKVDVTIENDWAYEPAPQNFVYDAAIVIGGATVYANSALTHFHHARWRKIFWWGAEPKTHIRHNIAYLLATQAVPNYDTSVTVSPTALNNLDASWSAAATGPMAAGIVTPAMPTAGGRPDIGPLPQWAAMYLLSMDSRAKNITLGVGDLAGSWPIHYRDKNTDRPVSLLDYPYMTLFGRPGDAINQVSHKSELFPTCVGDCSTMPANYNYNYNPDASHQPSMAYLPYLITGDYFYLEELQFWANWNMLQANPYYRQFEKGIMAWDQVRGQAWSLRTLGQAGYITPDGHPMKQYFIDRVNDNLNWYNTTYASGKPNMLGMIDGSGQYAFAAIAYSTSVGPQTGIAPWQDDFFTWSVGYLAELGYTKATPLLAWKAKFPVGRMTASGYCWIDAAAYALSVRPSATAPLYSTFNEAYLATMRNSDGTAMSNSTGATYLSQACASQAQADWRTQFDLDTQTKRNPWLMGEMTGYAASQIGYPANMQPALAVAANSGVSNALAAWTLFAQRAVKPNYADAPQWAIVPR